MHISELISKENIVMDLKASSKKEALQNLSEALSSSSKVPAHLVLEALEERERLDSTALGKGVALPHGRLKNLPKITCVFAKNTPVDFDSKDGEPVSLFFGILVPEEAGSDYLKVLSTLTLQIKKQEFVAALLKASSKEEIFSVFLGK